MAVSSSKRVASVRFVCVAGLGLAAALLLVAGCTAGTASGARPPAGSGGSTGGPTGGAAASGATATGGHPGSGGTGSTATGGTHASTGGSRGSLDASAGDADASCSHLNIGILGNPGSNGSSNFQAWLETKGTTVQRVQTTTDVPLTADVLQPFDVVILDSLVRNYTADEAAVFASWVSAGGGVAAMSGYNDNTTTDWYANSLLAPLGVAYALPRLWGPVTQFAAHPITAGLTSVTFTGGYAVSDLGGNATTRTPIGFLSTNPGTTPVAYAIEMGAGHAFVWGDEWIEYDSEWSSMPQIPVLWLQVFNWISPPERCMLTGIGPISALSIPSNRRCG